VRVDLHEVIQDFQRRSLLTPVHEGVTCPSEHEVRWLDFEAKRSRYSCIV
jgi:hypothetical protein